jgi:hypothetical protein
MATADEVLSKLEEIRNERYRAIRIWMEEIKESKDLRDVQKLIPHLEKSIYECETLDALLHDLYIGLKQPSQRSIS